MPPYKKVLFPLDYSLPCEAVLPYVREMAQRPGSELTILQCLPLWCTRPAEAMTTRPTPLA